MFELNGPHAPQDPKLHCGARPLHFVTPGVHEHQP